MVMDFMMSESRAFSTVENLVDTARRHARFIVEDFNELEEGNLVLTGNAAKAIYLFSKIPSTKGVLKYILTQNDLKIITANELEVIVGPM